MGWVALSGTLIGKMTPVKTAAGASPTTDFVEMEFVVPDTEESDVLGLITDGSDGGFVNNVRQIGWNSTANVFDVKCISIAKVRQDDSTEVWKILCQTSTNPGSTAYGYIKDMYAPYGTQASSTLQVEDKL